MKLPLQITLRDIPPSAALEAAINEKAEKLERFYQYVMACRVTVEIPGKHKHKGNEFKVTVDITVPGSEIVINRDHHEDVYVALRDAFDAAKRQLEDYARKQRGEIKAHDEENRGRVARLFAEGNYGFIEGLDGREYYFSADNVVHPTFEQLEPGMSVSFLQAWEGDTPQAKRVSAA